MTIDVTRIETALPELLSNEFDLGLLRQKATVSFQRDGPGSSFSILPFETVHASVYAFYENGGAIVYLTIGDNTVLEVPIKGGGYTEKHGERELVEILRAVINRGFEERVWEIGGRTVKSIAELPINGEAKPITIVSSSLYNPFRRKKLFVRKYLPYY